ncbi:hypothetical protein [Pseudopedobacter beijingensis]|uniref:Uncharacterized protein n=1 Tax=Pseudopedobacter beijingensis TaxID=1207056 RepID=A0ABW4IC68_9SPHI
MPKIQNLQQLRAEIQVLRQKKIEQELYFSQKKESLQEAVRSPFKFARKMVNFFSGGKANEIQADWTTAMLRFAIPFLLNKTLLKGKGGIIKSAIALISQKAINPSLFNQATISGLVDKVSGWVSNILPGRKKKEVDYGIPPDSETS